jgi:hypothetical protein
MPTSGSIDPSATRHTAPTADGLDVAVNNIFASLDDPNAGGLTAEYLIASAQARLGTVDGQIKAMVGEMNTKSDQLNHLRNAMQQIDAWRGVHHGDDAARLGVNDTFTSVDVNGTRHDTTLGSELSQADINPTSVRGSDAAHPDRLSNADLEQLCDRIRSRIDELQQGSEIQQVNLQQLVSQRGAAVQTASQIMASMHETDKSILQNVR